ncbi:MAG: proton-conducting transporter membrane subunit [Paludibacter sp.]|jgi:multicomponent Na+:H+ antiporter subunit A|nr:proton-conducting transporter membrane subunit [Paludibacter sp.]
MVNVILAIFSLAFLLFLFPRKLKVYQGLVIAALLAAVFAWFSGKIPMVANGLAERISLGWLPELGLNVGFVLDGLSLSFALLVSGIGVLVFLYAHSYMKSYENTTKFFFFLLLFSGSMLGLVLSSNLIQLFIFWEFTTILSFFLISYFHEKEESRKAAFQSLVITFLGGLALLAGILVIGSIVDSYDIDVWLANTEKIKQSNLYLPGLLLMLGGVFTKSAQYPFHFWLPGAMQAPAPVSSYLHSATMVKAGVFLLMRLSPVLGGTAEWTSIVPLIGVLTMLTGSYFAITQTDLKAILAYTTINALGVLVLLLGINTEQSVKAAVLFLFIHAFYKASLFMIAGFIEKKTGTRNLNQLGGLMKSFPITFVITLFALLSMAGLPPMLGFLGKELIYEAKVQSPGFASLIFIFGFISNVLMFAVSMRILVKVFMGKPVKSYSIPINKKFFFVFGPGLLILLSLVMGLSPNLLGKLIIEPAATVVFGQQVDVKLALWHGFNMVLLLSAITVLIGAILSYLMIKYRVIEEQWNAINKRVFPYQLPQVFSLIIEKFVAVSVRKTKLLQHGYHRYYILTVIVFTAGLLWLQLILTRGWEFTLNFTFQPFYISGLLLIIVIATIYTTLTNSRTRAIVSMGVTGYGIALIFLYYSAVDLAITQILVETLIVVMFMLILQRLPFFARLSATSTKIRDFIVALIFGGAMTVVSLKAINVNFSSPISDFFMDNSFTKAFGENVVNVILVDFRALDTLGEVTVLVIAAMGVAALLKSKTIKK